MKYRLAMFDFNGTLADDLAVVYAGAAAVFKKFGVEPPSVETFRNCAAINNQWYHQQGIPQEVTDKMIHEVFSAALHLLWGDTRLRPDAITVARKLKEMKMITGVISALREPLFEERVRHFRIRGDFDFLMGGREDKRAAFLEMTDELGVPRNQALYVGDAASDVEAANSAGIISIAFTSGYNSPELLLAQKPDFMIKSLTELLEIVK